ncbi:MAG: LytTR family transcriptional regulator DNA-binding domain-containing protein [Actinomycetia bacterium]|nr:LytTR family transcriptional regulator DNA-binding domain-containing protein [Actinomycetes bacterium]
MKLNILVVEDEAPAREELVYLLKKSKYIEKIQEASNAKEALNVLRDQKLDIAFLDIQMPGITGIEIAEMVNAFPIKPFIVFITAYSEYAVKAFDFEAVDYLLKPFDEKKLHRAIKRVVIKKSEVVKIQNKMKLNNLVIKKSGRLILVPVEKILYAKAEGDYIYIITPDNSFLTNYSLKKLEKKTEGFNFFRTHRSYLVNLDRIKEIRSQKGRIEILFKEINGKVPVSRRKTKKLKVRIKQ